jgi:hypothetical protein
MRAGEEIMLSRPMMGGMKVVAVAAIAEPSARTQGK